MRKYFEKFLNIIAKIYLKLRNNQEESAKSSINKINKKEAFFFKL